MGTLLSAMWYESRAPIVVDETLFALHVGATTAKCGAPEMLGVQSWNVLSPESALFAEVKAQSARQPSSSTALPSSHSSPVVTIALPQPVLVQFASQPS